MAGRAVRSVSGLFAWVRRRPADAGEGSREPGVLAARGQYHRTLLLVLGFWALAVCVAAAIYPIAAFGVAVLALAHVFVAYRVEQHRRTGGPGQPSGVP